MKKETYKMKDKEAKKLKERKKRAIAIMKELKRLFPKAKIALRYRNNWELLVSVVLSAQTTDKKVNEVTTNLFQKYKRLDDYVAAKLKEFEGDIKKIGLYKTKAKNILTTANIIKKKYKGKIPKSMEELTALAGVGRKTANIILGTAYGIVEGIAVDTHVLRLSNLLGFIKSNKPEKIEKRLKELFLKKDWVNSSHWLATHGRLICIARSPKCGECFLADLCPGFKLENK
ncbi:MAG: endonuclease III [Bacteroidetes bacterium]|nr:endonuclease III [Bacteroidota bacterium]